MSGGMRWQVVPLLLYPSSDASLAHLVQVVTTFLSSVKVPFPFVVSVPWDETLAQCEYPVYQ